MKHMNHKLWLSFGHKITKPASQAIIFQKVRLETATTGKNIFAKLTKFLSFVDWAIKF
jgi:hypothetical protein